MPVKIRGVGDHPEIPSVDLYSTTDGTIIENVAGTSTVGWPFMINESEVVMRDVHVIGSDYSAVGVWDSKLSIEGCTLQDNSLNLKAGAIYGEGSVELTIDDCVFAGNSGDDAGAILIEGGSLTVRTSEFTANSGAEVSAI
ncbi:MAG: right-handed parallel beta-helix repeat-containing protein [Proteobacteria bacterium]|nr:right-handed parallel beta-helix repeat-containing protein [Pseudomonadota bacterium]MCP4921333.1 right-handed parallel beta-helix repeat-containing protein [Pseudomonadota bacterium]